MRVLLKCMSFVLVLVLILGCLGVSAETFVAPNIFIYGDIDMDGSVTVKDATAIQKGIAGLTYLTGVQKFLADPDNTGVSVKNATAIQKHVADMNIENSVIGNAVDMATTDEFSSAITKGADFEGNCVIVMPYFDLEYIYEYTLEDFPEYEFESIKTMGSKEKGYIFYTLYLKYPSKENALEAIKALEYRANIDLDSVGPNYIAYAE